MADNEKIIYDVEVQVAKANQDLDKLRAKFKEVFSQFDSKLKLDTNFQINGLSDFRTLQQRLTEARKAIQLLREEQAKFVGISSKGIHIDGLKETQSEITANVTALRGLEKALEDSISAFKAGSLNNQIKEQKALQTELLNTQKEYDKLSKAFNRSFTNKRAWNEDKFATQAESAKILTDRVNELKRQLGQSTKVENFMSGYTNYDNYYKQTKQYADKLAQLQANQAEQQRQKQQAINSATQAYQNLIDQINKKKQLGIQLSEKEYMATQKQLKTASQKVASVGGNVSTLPQMPTRTEYNSAAQGNYFSGLNEKLLEATKLSTSYTQQMSRLQSVLDTATYAWNRSGRSNEQYRQIMIQTKNALDQTGKSLQKLQQNMGVTQSASDKFFSGLRRHATWIASSVLASVPLTVPFLAINQMKEIESEFATVMQVMPEIEHAKWDSINPNLSSDKQAEGMKKVNDEMNTFIDIGKKYGLAAQEVIEAGASIGRMYGQGENGIANTNLLTQQAARIAVADNFPMIQATKGLESALSQFGLQTEDTDQLLINSNRIIDVWTMAAHNGAASANDLTQGVQQAGAAAHQAGVSFEFLNALIATGVRNTAKSGNEIGTSIKSFLNSMQSSKSIAALQDFGVDVYKDNGDGTKSLRSMESVMLDVSRMMQTTNKDYSNLLLTLSGGKFQVSKLTAILKDYKELVRMTGLLNSEKVNGFTDQQIDIQLETLSRKLEQLHTSLTGLFVDIGSEGGLDSLKDGVDYINNIVTGIKEMNIQWGFWVKTLVYGAAALKGFPFLVNNIAKLSGRIAGATEGYQKGTRSTKDILYDKWGIHTQDSYNKGKEATLYGKSNIGQNSAETADNTIKTQENTGSVNANKIARDAVAGSIAKENVVLTENTGVKAGNTGVLQSNTSAKTNNALSSSEQAVAEQVETNATVENTGATAVNTNAKNINTASEEANGTIKRVNTVSTNTESVAQTRNTATTEANTIAKRLNTAATSTLATVSKGASIALAAFGGPVGIAITALSILVPLIVSHAESLGEETNAQQKLNDTIDEHVAKIEESLDRRTRSIQSAQELAEQYNYLKDRLDTLTEGTKEYTKTKENMQYTFDAIKSSLQDENGNLQDNAIEWQNNGHIAIGSMEKLTEKDKETALAQINNEIEKLETQKQATQNFIKLTNDRIQAMKEEGKQIGLLTQLESLYWQAVGAVQQNRGNALLRRADEAQKAMDRGEGHWTAEQIADMRKQAQENLSGGTYNIQYGQSLTGSTDELEKNAQNAQDRLNQIESKENELTIKRGLLSSNKVFTGGADSNRNGGYVDVPDGDSKADKKAEKARKEAEKQAEQQRQYSEAQQKITNSSIGSMTNYANRTSSSIYAMPNDVDPKYWDVAQKVAQKAGVPDWARYIYGQMSAETGRFSSSTAINNNNLSGMHGGEGYAYASINDFIDEYAATLRNWDSKELVTGIDSFAQVAKANGYYTDSVEHYASLLQSTTPSTSTQEPLTQKYYNVDSEVSIPTLNPNTEEKLNRLSKMYYDRTGEQLNVTSMTRDWGTGSWHDQGQAFDVAQDTLKNDVGLREWFIVQAEKLNLVPLDEYTDPSAGATGGHLHFSNRNDNAIGLDGSYSGGSTLTSVGAVKEIFSNWGIDEYKQSMLAGAKTIEDIVRITDSMGANLRHNQTPAGAGDIVYTTTGQAYVITGENGYTGIDGQHEGNWREDLKDVLLPTFTSATNATGLTLENAKAVGDSIKLSKEAKDFFDFKVNEVSNQNELYSQNRERQQKEIEQNNKTVSYRRSVYGQYDAQASAIEASSAQRAYDIAQTNYKFITQSRDKLEQQISDVFKNNSLLKDKVDPFGGWQNISDKQLDELMDKYVAYTKDENLKKAIEDYRKYKEAVASANEEIQNTTVELNRVKGIKNAEETLNTKLEEIQTNSAYWKSDFANQHGGSYDGIEWLTNKQNHQDALEQIKAYTEYLKKLEAERDNMLAQEVRNEEQIRLTNKAIAETKTKLNEVTKTAEETGDKLSKQSKETISGMLYDLIKGGKSFKDVWTDIWNQVAEVAIQRLMGIKDSTNSMWDMLSNVFGFGKTKEETKDRKTAIPNAQTDSTINYFTNSNSQALDFATRTAIDTFSNPNATRLNPVTKMTLGYFNQGGMVNGTTLGAGLTDETTEMSASNTNMSAANTMLQASNNNLQSAQMMANGGSNGVSGNNAIQGNAENPVNSSDLQAAQISQQAAQTNLMASQIGQTSAQTNLASSNIDSTISLTDKALSTVDQATTAQDATTSGINTAASSQMLVAALTMESAAAIMSASSFGTGLGGFAKGGSLTKFATGGHIISNGGKIKGAGTGTSDSILAWLGDQGRFIGVSNGEYIMNAKATKKYGGILEQMNLDKFATGGSLSPEPYVPTLRNPNVVNNITKNEAQKQNSNAKLEALMGQQNGILQGMANGDKDSNSGQVVVLNTNASKDEIFKALASDPRALQTLLGNNKRRGFR